MRPFAVAALTAACTAWTCVSPGSAAETGPEVRLDMASRSALQITVYGNGLSLITDTRSADLTTTPQRFVIDGVSRRMIPSSALVGAGSDLRVLATEYDTDVLTAATLLDRAVGQTVGIIRTDPTTGMDLKLEDAEVLSTEGGLVLRYQDRIETGVPGRIVFPKLPPDLRPRPALIATVEAEAAGTAPLTLTYLTDGLSWSADYAIVMDDATDTLGIDGRATIVNESGVDFDDASVALIAGEVHRQSKAGMRPRVVMAAPAERAMMADAAPPQPERESFGDLHLYRLPGTVTLSNRRQRQIAFLHADGVPVERYYVSRHGVSVYGAVVGETRPDHPVVRLRIVNNPGAGGGEPWPAGLARIYATDAEGTLRLVGEDSMPRTPRGERAELTPGRAFDITIRRTQTDFDRSGLGQAVFESAYKLEVANGRDDAVSVDLLETLSGDWRILEESAPHEEPDARTAKWTVDVPAGGTTTLTYRVRVTNR